MTYREIKVGQGTFKKYLLNETGYSYWLCDVLYINANECIYYEGDVIEDWWSRLPISIVEEKNDLPDYVIAIIDNISPAPGKNIKYSLYAYSLDMIGNSYAYTEKEKPEVGDILLVPSVSGMGEISDPTQLTQVFTITQVDEDVIYARKDEESIVLHLTRAPDKDYKEYITEVRDVVDVNPDSLVMSPKGTALKGVNVLGEGSAGVVRVRLTSDGNAIYRNGVKLSFNEVKTLVMDETKLITLTLDDNVSFFPSAYDGDAIWFDAGFIEDNVANQLRVIINKDNQVKVDQIELADKSKVYTKEEVDSKIQNITKTSELENDGDGESPFVTEEELESTIVTKTSELENDGDGTSPFVTEEDLGDGSVDKFNVSSKESINIETTDSDAEINITGQGNVNIHSKNEVLIDAESPTNVGNATYPTYLFGAGATVDIDSEVNISAKEGSDVNINGNNLKFNGAPFVPSGIQLLSDGTNIKEYALARPDNTVTVVKLKGSPDRPSSLSSNQYGIYTIYKTAGWIKIECRVESTVPYLNTVVKLGTNNWGDWLGYVFSINGVVSKNGYGSTHYSAGFECSIDRGTIKLDTGEEYIRTCGNSGGSFIYDNISSGDEDYIWDIYAYGGGDDDDDECYLHLTVYQGYRHTVVHCNSSYAGAYKNAILELDAEFNPNEAGVQYLTTGATIVYPRRANFEVFMKKIKDGTAVVYIDIHMGRV